MDPVVDASCLTENRDAIFVFLASNVQAILVFGGTIFVTRSSTLISRIDTASLTENMTAVIVLVSAFLFASPNHVAAITVCKDSSDLLSIMVEGGIF